jgi:P27 family predicted phage terminase small subunit
MGERGPAAQPTRLKVLKGERKDRINASEPEPPHTQKPPTCPSALSPTARRIWRRLAPQLHRERLLTDWDRETFAAYCIAAGLLLDGAKEIRTPQTDADGNPIEGTSGIVVKGDRSNRVKHPAIQVVRDAGNDMRQWAKHFGLTPAGRAMLEVPPTADDDPDRLLS